MSASEADPGDRFRRLYAEHFNAVLGFALRRCDRPEDAADVVAETFLVAWRRLGHVPETDTRPWLYGVARRVLANHRRGDRRRAALGSRLRDQLAHLSPDVAESVARRTDVEAAMARLSGRDEEILQLHLWEGLEPREIAEVLGTTPEIVRPRLSRARARLRDLLGNDARPAGHDHSRTPRLARTEDQP